MTPTLWMKFPDEALFSTQYDGAEKKRLEAVFSTSDPASPWQQALALLRLPPTKANVELIKWHKGAPYFNWSCMADTVSGGAINVVQKQNGGYRLDIIYKLKSLWHLCVAHWKMTRFMKQKPEDSIAASIALGIVLQSMIMRMPAVHMPKLAELLADPAALHPAVKQLVMRIQGIQAQRTAMSYVWKDVHPKADQGDPQKLPEFFWDDGVVSEEQQQPTAVASGAWKALPVCTGKVTGLAVVMMPGIDAQKLDDLKRRHEAPLVLVFKSARPQTVDFFPQADALLFAVGGMLSHACTVARSMNIPSVTGLGAEFFDEISRHDKIWLTIDGATGDVQLADIPLPGRLH